MRRIGTTLAVGVILLAAGMAVFGLYLSWQAFLELCPNKDVLHWDGNLRAVLVLDRYQMLLDGRIGEVVVSHFGSHTWPPLRPLLSLILFGVMGPNMVADVAISFVFFALLFLAVLLASARMSDSLWGAATVFFFAVAMLLHTRELNAYALASMLETQGMFFLVLCVWALFLLYERDQLADTAGGTVGRLAGKGSRAILGLIVRPAGVPVASRRVVFWLLVLGVQGLTFTKYPYAVILFVAVGLFEVLRAPYRWWGIASELWASHYRGLRRLLIVAFVLVVVALMAAGKVGYLGVNTKVTKRVIYLISLAIFIDFNSYLFRSRGSATTLFPASIREFYIAGILPTLVWIFIHPDRFSAILGGQFWIGTTIVRQTLFETLGYLFQPSWPAILILAAGPAVLLGRFLSASGSAADRWRETIRRPDLAVLAVCWLMFIAQDLFNPNKQDRHVYHIVPALLLASAVVIQGGGGLLWGRLGSVIAGAVLLAVAVVPTISPSGMAAHGYRRERHFCYTDVRPEIFAEARWAAGQLSPPNARFVTINDFHEIPVVMSPRNQASEIDLLLRMRALRMGGRLQSDSRHRFPSWKGFDHLILLAPNCDLPELRTKVVRRSRETGSRLTRTRRAVHPSGQLCLDQWRIDSAEQ